MTGPGRFASTAATHVGLLREVNEDRLLDRSDAGLWAVADGMGGHRGGGEAAAAAIRELDACAGAPRGLSVARVRDALGRANAAIRQATREGSVSGCTIAGFFAQDDEVQVFWAGDARVYRLRDGVLTCLTHDHSLVQELVDAGTLTPDQARRHPRANVVTRALGTDAEVAVDFASTDWRAGDRYLACSDGVWGMVDDAAIAAAMALPLDRVADQLRRAALDGGGRDNLALVAAERSDAR